MRLPVDEVRRLSHDALTRNGLTAQEARTVTDVLVEAELRGRKTHGMIRVPLVIQRRAAKEPVPIQTKVEGPSFALLDGGDNLGYLVALRCAETAAAKAQASGLALVGAHNLGHTGMMGYYASKIAEEGLIGLGVSDSMRGIVPWGGSEPVFGTNPIAIGIPTGSGPPILADLSTGALTFGQLALARQAGETIPADRAVDGSGRFTQDPNEALKGGVLPFGGHKGSALALAVQVFCSALVGGDVLPKHGKNYGVCLAAVDPGVFVPVEDFYRDVAELVRAVKAARKMPGVTEILIPGERAYRERAQRLKEGIELDDGLHAQLAALSQGEGGLRKA